MYFSKERQFSESYSQRFAMTTAGIWQRVAKNSALGALCTYSMYVARALWYHTYVTLPEAKQLHLLYIVVVSSD